MWNVRCGMRSVKCVILSVTPQGVKSKDPDQKKL